MNTIIINTTKNIKKLHYKNKNKLSNISNISDIKIESKLSPKEENIINQVNVNATDVNLNEIQPKELHIINDPNSLNSLTSKLLKDQQIKILTWNVNGLRDVYQNGTFDLFLEKGMI